MSKAIERLTNLPRGAKYALAAAYGALFWGGLMSLVAY
jgi:hypothetical protein